MNTDKTENKTENKPDSAATSHQLLRTNPEAARKYLLENCACRLCRSTIPRWACVTLENTARQSMTPSELLGIADMKLTLQVSGLMSRLPSIEENQPRANLVPLVFLGLSDGVPFAFETQKSSGLLRTKEEHPIKRQSLRLKLWKMGRSYFLHNSQNNSREDGTNL